MVAGQWGRGGCRGLCGGGVGRIWGEGWGGGVDDVVDSDPNSLSMSGFISDSEDGVLPQWIMLSSLA